jgi:drug/metabolite transporter (DMT)-like permease
LNILAAALCIVLFSLTVPFTRLAALETTPIAIIFLRMIGAGIVSIIFASFDKWLPPRSSWKGIFFTALGSVIGFASFTAFAMKEVPSGHGAVGLAAMPIATAAYSVLRDKRNPGIFFWFFAVLGTALSFAFFFFLNVSDLVLGDLYLVCAVLCAAFGYVEGGRTSRIHGGKRVMTWAVIATLPFALPLAIFYFLKGGVNLSVISTNAWLCMIYLALVSQSTGMFLWFRVLAIGPMEKIALVQLLQPFFTLLASILFLHETVLWSTWIIAFLVAICVFGANRTRN